MTVTEVFAAAALTPQGAVPWKTPVPVEVPGVYVIAETPENVLYIGKATNLGKRLAQFYRHKYGAKAPHSGGQELLLLTCDKLVYWAATDDARGAERAMIAAYRERVGARPYANRRS